MAGLFDQIKGINEEAAMELKDAGFITDRDITSLDRQDLLELLPGKSKIRLRKKIHEVINTFPKPSNTPLSDDLQRISKLISESLVNSHSETSTLWDYLCILKKQKYHSKADEDFIKEQINNILESPQEKMFEGYPDSDHSSRETPPNSTVSDSEKYSLFSGITLPSFWPLSKSDIRNTQRKPNTTPTAKLQTANVSYEMVVSGKTLNKHFEIIERLNGLVLGNGGPPVNLNLMNMNENGQVIIVFCPVVSRAGTDVDAALRGISNKSGKPVIVVAMHHMHTPTSLPAPRTSPQIQLGVNIFFHETSGLLNCPQNDDAINEIKAKLLEYCPKRTKN